MLSLNQYFSQKYIQKRQNKGFTLLELLLAAAMGMIVSGSILGLTNNVLNDSQKEIARSKTQQQMKTALNYLSEELREAVYIYTGEGLNKIKPYLPSFPITKTPVLAFWKVESLPYNNQGSLPTNCNSFTTDELKDECKGLLIERNTYTLVVYLQSTSEPNSWKGQSRLERYELRKYSNPKTLTKSPGYADPRRETTFGDWPLDGSDNNQQVTGTMNTTTEPLVDFVYLQDIAKSNLTLTTLPSCITDTTDEYFSSPVYDSTNNKNYSRGVYFCISFEDQDADQDPDTYQDVQIFLTGNAKGQTGYQTNDSLVPLETQIMTKGVIDKTSVD
jgi:type II secretory pathway pseudopilin PulG